MALECLRFLCQEITDLAIEEVDAELLDNLVLWKYNGGDATIREFRALDPEMREEVLNFLEDFSLYEELTVGEKTVSAGAWRAGWIHTGKEDRGIFPARSCMGQTRLSEGILCGYKSGNRTYTDADDSGKMIIPGIFIKKYHHIAIDCGACFPGGRLAAICLETGEEFYSSDNNG